MENHLLLLWPCHEVTKSTYFNLVHLYSSTIFLTLAVFELLCCNMSISYWVNGGLYFLYCFVNFCQIMLSQASLVIHYSTYEIEPISVWQYIYWLTYRSKVTYPGHTHIVLRLSTYISNINAVFND